MKLEERLDFLDKHFGFRENPEQFSFKLDPRRVAYRNEALRTGNRDLYVGYLADKYPNEMEAELEDYDKVKLERVDVANAGSIFRQNKINLLEADLDFSDPDAIFTMMVVDEDQISWLTEENNTDLIGAQVEPREVLDNRDSILLDLSRAVTYRDGKKVYGVFK